MNKRLELLEKTHIALTLGTSLTRFADSSVQAEVLRQRLLRLIHEMTEDIALPGEIALEVMLAEEKDAPMLALYPFQVKVNGERCRAEFPLKVSEDVSAEGLARTIMQVIDQNRELFVTPALCKQFRQQWLSGSENTDNRGNMGNTGNTENAQYLSAPALQKLCQLLVQRGFSISRAEETFQASPQKLRLNRSVESLFEETVADWNSIGWTIYLSQAANDALVTLPENAGGDAAEGHHPFQRGVERIRNAIFRDLGLIVPVPAIVVDEILGEQEFRLRLNDVRMAPQAVPYNEIEATIYFSLMSKAGALLVTDAVKYALNMLRKTFAMLVQTTLALHDEQQLTGILRCLLDEEISIKDLRGILEGLTAVNGITNLDIDQKEILFPTTANFYPVATERAVEDIEDLGIEDFANCIRLTLKNYLSYKYTAWKYTLYVCMLETQLAERMKSVESEPLSDEEYCLLIQAISYTLEHLPASAKNPVLLTRLRERRSIKKQIEREFPSLAVLSLHELLSTVPAELAGRISLTPPAPTAPVNP